MGNGKSSMMELKQLVFISTLPPIKTYLLPYSKNKLNKSYPKVPDENRKKKICVLGKDNNFWNRTKKSTDHKRKKKAGKFNFIKIKSFSPRMWERKATESMSENSLISKHLKHSCNLIVRQTEGNRGENIKNPLLKKIYEFQKLVVMREI